MKKLFFFLMLLLGVSVSAQTVPQGINYQAVALDQSGQPIPGIDIVGRPIDDAEIGVRIAILDNPQSGTVLYEELHEVRTDLYGMFNLVIGMGATLSVDPFSSINWQGDKFLKVELSIDNDGNYALSAVQQLMSVPYAFLAEKAMVAQTAVDIDDADADPTNELQTLSVTGDSLTLSNGNTVELPVINDADADPTNEIQVLSRSSDTIYLSNGGYAVLPADQVNDADADPSNELQTITRSGTDITLSGNGGSVSVFDGNYNNLSNTPAIPTNTSDLTNDSGFLTTEVDGSTTNELQTISKAGGAITLSDNGGSITVFDGDYNSLSNTPTIPSKTSDLTNNSGFLSSEVDGSTTNELQTISKAGGAITLSDNGGSITVFDGDYNDLSNTPTIPTTTSDLTNDSGFLTTEVDGSTTNELQTISKTGGAITLSDNGGSVTVFDGDYNNLTNTPTIPSKTSDLNNDNGFITSEQDSSTTNELQTLLISNDTIYLSDGGFVKLPNLVQNNSNITASTLLMPDRDTLVYHYEKTYGYGQYDAAQYKIDTTIHTFNLQAGDRLKIKMPIRTQQTTSSLYNNEILRSSWYLTDDLQDTLIFFAEGFALNGNRFGSSSANAHTARMGYYYVLPYDVNHVAYTMTFSIPATGVYYFRLVGEMGRQHQNNYVSPKKVFSPTMFIQIN